jgi:hypothetical protein
MLSTVDNFCCDAVDAATLSPRILPNASDTKQSCEKLSIGR